MLFLQINLLLKLFIYQLALELLKNLLDLILFCATLELVPDRIHAKMLVNCDRLICICI